MDNRSVDLIFTSPDPPQSYKQVINLAAFFQSVADIVKDTGSLWVQLGDSHDEGGRLRAIPHCFAMAMSDSNWILRSDIIWHRPDNSIQEDYTRFKRDCEHLFFFTKSKDRYYFNDDMVNVGTSLAIHPFLPPLTDAFASGFPEELIELAVNACTRVGDTVLDPFCDSATTGVVALRMARKFIGIEIDPAKIARINQRLRKQ